MPGEPGGWQDERMSVGGSVRDRDSPHPGLLVRYRSQARRPRHAGEGKLEPKLQQTRSHPRASGDLCLMAQRRFPPSRE